jgi:hypothetical protein
LSRVGRLEVTRDNAAGSRRGLRTWLVLTAFRRAGNLFLCVWDTRAARALVAEPRGCTRSDHLMALPRHELSGGRL